MARRRLRPDVRSKLLSITSTRTDASFIPEAWRFVFLDEATTGRCRIVRVATDASSEPSPQREPNAVKLEMVDSCEAIPQDNLIVDSDQVLEKIREISKLKGVLSTQYRLLQSTASHQPMWHLSFYGAAVEPMACFQVDPRTGKVTSQKKHENVQSLKLSSQIPSGVRAL